MMPENVHKKVSPLLYLIPSALLCLLVYALWPFYKYYVDPDAICYLNITEQYLKGNYHNAINSFWSPLGSWLTAVLLKITVLPIFTAAIIVNTIPTVGMLLASQQIFHQFRTSNWERWCFGIASALFWTYTVYYQSFTDIWQFCFLTLALIVLLKDKFIEKPLWWLGIGLLGVISFFGKAYSFMYFPLMVAIASGMAIYNHPKYGWRRWMVITATATLTMMLLATPWIYLLYQKYHILTYSTAGKLNLVWWMVGTQELREGVDVLVPPPYPGSLFYFEDPYLLQGSMPHFWDSPKLFLKLIVRLCYNVLDWFQSSSRLSVFYFVVWLMAIAGIFTANIRNKTSKNLQIITLLFLSFPLPFWLMTFNGGRYLWFTLPLMAIVALCFADKVVYPYINNKVKKGFIAVFFLAFIITPVSDMSHIFRSGQKAQEQAAVLEQLNIKGAFISNKSYADAAQELIQLSWFSKNPWYCHRLNQVTTEQLLEDAQRYPIKYYFYFYEGTGNNYELKNSHEQSFPELTQGAIPGMKVFEIAKKK
jgi:hypothetical protein